MPPPSSLTPKRSSLLRVSESQAISNSSSFISSTTSSSSLFDRISGASSGCLTDFSSPFTPSIAEFKDQAFLPNRRAHDRGLSPSPSRLSQSTNVFPSSRLDRARALEARSSTFSHRQNKTPFVSLIPRAVGRNEDRGYHLAPASKDTFDACKILRNRVEQEIPTVATRRALKIMDSGGRSPAAGLNGSAGGAEEESLKVVVTGPDSIVDDWSRDFESSSDAKFCPEPSTDLNTTIPLCTPENDNHSETVAAHSSIIFPSASDRSLLDEVERDFLSSAMPPKFSVKFPSKPVLKPPFSDLPCSPFMLGTPDLSANWEGSSSSLSTLMAESPPSQISSPANMSFDEEEIARIMSTVISFPTRSQHLFPGSPQGDVDAATVMRVEIASTLRGDHPQPHVGQTRPLIGLGVVMPVIYTPLPSEIFPSHPLSEAPLNSRSLQGLGYQSFDHRMFEVEQTSVAPLSRNVNQPSLPKNEIIDEMDEVLLFSPLEGCPASTPLLSNADFECSVPFQVEPTLSLGHTSINHTSPIVSGKVLVGLGLGLDNLTEASVKSKALPPEPSPTTGRHNLVSGDESITEGEVSLPPVTDFFLQAQKSFNFEPLGVQKIVELDASQLERQSALYNLEHSDLLLDHIFSHSPPIQLQKKNEIERQLLANLFKKKSCHRFKSQKHGHNPSSHSYTLTTNKVAEPRSVKQSRSYQTLRKFGLERFFQPRSGRDDLNLTSPSGPQEDPRSPTLLTREAVFATFSSLNAPSSCPTRSQSSGSVRPVEEPGTHPEYEASSKAKKNMQIGLGLPSRVVFRRKLRLQETSSQGSVDAIRCQSRRFSQEFQNPSFIVTEPSFSSSYISRVQSSNQFLKPSQFTQRSLFDIVEVPTPPSSTSSSPRRTPSPGHQWSPPFVRLNVPQKRRSPRSQLSTPSVVAVSSDIEVGATVDLSPEIPAVTPAASARRGFKRLVSKFARGLFKRSRTLKTGDLLSPVVIEHADAPPGLGLLRQGASCAPQLQSMNLQVLF